MACGNWRKIGGDSMSSATRKPVTMRAAMERSGHAHHTEKKSSKPTFTWLATARHLLVIAWTAFRLSTLKALARSESHFSLAFLLVRTCIGSEVLCSSAHSSSTGRSCGVSNGCTSSSQAR